MTKIKNILKLQNKQIEDLKRYEAYLFPGVYRCFCIDNSRFIWRRCERFSDYFRYTDHKKGFTIKKRIKAFLIGKTKKIKQKTNKSCGTSLYVSRKGNIKVFSNDMKHVFYFVSDKDLFNKAVHYKKYYARFFGRSIIESVDSSCKRINERYISENYNWRKSEREVHNAGCWIMKKSVEYLNSVNKDIKLRIFSDFANEVKSRTHIAELERFLDVLSNSFEIENYSIPFVYQHNDVVLSNILKENDEYTLFDYEFYGENIFYYDSLMWIVWEAVHYSHDIYLHEFLSGKFDKYFQQMFLSVGMKYNTDRRIDYVLMFIIANINIHQLTGDSTNIQDYKRVVSMMLNE